MRYAIVTPYYKEPPEFLRRCIDSVRAQGVKTEHLLIADGYPQDWLDSAGIRHIKLDRAHGDYGNTPRSIGGLLAIAEQFDGFGFLDADNWLEPNHVEHCLAAYNAAKAEGRDVSYVAAKRNWRRPDQTIIPLADEPLDQHVDTNCFFFFPGSYHIVPYFGTMPKELSVIGDRVFYHTLRSRGLTGIQCQETTVNYHCLWPAVYRAANETPPPEATHRVDTGPVSTWLGSLTPEQHKIMEQLTGLKP